MDNIILMLQKDIAQIYLILGEVMKYCFFFLGQACLDAPQIEHVACHISAFIE